MQSRFLSSHSQALGFASGEEKTFGLDDRIRNAFSQQHIAGTISLLISQYTIAQTLSGARKEKDWLRAGSSWGGLAATSAFMLSSRSGDFPEADTFWQRSLKAIKHPDQYAVHASYVYGFPPTLMNQVSHIYHGITGPVEERARLATGLLSTAAYALTWKSMFGNPKGVGNTAKTNNMEKQDNMLKFMFHDPEGLVSRLLPIAIRATTVVEGQMKKSRGNPAGKDFFTSSIIDICNQLFFIGYTYQQLWKAHQRDHSPKPQQSWAEKMLDEQSKNQHSIPSRQRSREP